MARPESRVPRLHKPTGQWYVRRKGKQYYLGKELDAAIDRMKLLDADLVLGLTPKRAAKAEHTIGTLCQAYLDETEREVAVGDITPTTQANRIDTARWLKKRIHPSEPLDVSLLPKLLEVRDKVVKDLSGGGAKSTIKRLRALVNWGRKRKMHELDISEVLKLPPARKVRLDKQDRRWSQEQFTEAFTRAQDMPPEVMAGILTLFLTASYSSELCTYRWADIDDKGFLRTVRPKTGNRRVIWLPPVLLETLDNVRQGPMLLTKPDGKPIYRQRPRNRTIWLFQKLGMPVAGLRHTWASTIAGIDDSAAKLVMGHEDHSQFATYSGTAEDARVKRVCLYGCYAIDHFGGMALGEESTMGYPPWGQMVEEDESSRSRAGFDESKVAYISGDLRLKEWR